MGGGFIRGVQPRRPHPRFRGGGGCGVGAVGWGKALSRLASCGVRVGLRVERDRRVAQEGQDLRVRRASMRRKRKTKALAPQLPAAGVGTALRSGPPQNLRDVLGCDGRVVERLTAAADPRGVADLPRAARQTVFRTGRGGRFASVLYGSGGAHVRFVREGGGGGGDTPRRPSDTRAAAWRGVAAGARALAAKGGIP